MIRMGLMGLALILSFSTPSYSQAVASGIHSQIRRICQDLVTKRVKKPERVPEINRCIVNLEIYL